LSAFIITNKQRLCNNFPGSRHYLIVSCGPTKAQTTLPFSLVLKFYLHLRANNLYCKLYTVQTDTKTKSVT